MDERARHDRTLRLLEARLETLAKASERTPRGELRLEAQILATAAATRRAVSLGLIHAHEADRAWAAVARRHPRAAWCRNRPRTLAA
jgi:hypothetical protein